ncbi:hypothetical protein FJQ98_09485 [Lysinibacillus agricola]|uniref:Uncharacterized protein n=1 Tax=Lysinibacillus agricola TaxID=2590012 RepID=A0ABX7AY76_9BACI|nr:hypothetical protein [Lysinibacillus agricola]QQP14222.1 hypothetical protein FJQ98_09485 [Lysinibacillus agricola]
MKEIMWAHHHNEGLISLTSNEPLRATNGFCAKAKRQQQMVSVRKRSDSNKWFLYDAFIYCNHS